MTEKFIWFVETILNISNVDDNKILYKGVKNELRKGMYHQIVDVGKKKQTWQVLRAFDPKWIY